MCEEKKVRRWWRACVTLGKKKVVVLVLTVFACLRLARCHESDLGSAQKPGKWCMQASHILNVGGDVWREKKATDDFVWGCIDAFETIEVQKPLYSITNTLSVTLLAARAFPLIA